MILTQNIDLLNFNPTTKAKIQSAIEQLSAKRVMPIGHDAIFQQILKLESPAVTSILTSTYMELLYLIVIPLTTVRKSPD